MRYCLECTEQWSRQMQRQVRLWAWALEEPKEYRDSGTLFPKEPMTKEGWLRPIGMRPGEKHRGPSFRNTDYLSSFELLKTMSDPFGLFKTFCRIVLRGSLHNGQEPVQNKVGKSDGKGNQISSFFLSSSTVSQSAVVFVCGFVFAT